MTENELRRGVLLWQHQTELTRAYARNRLTLTEERLRGASLRSGTDPATLAELERDRAFYAGQL